MKKIVLFILVLFSFSALRSQQDTTNNISFVSNVLKSEFDSFSNVKDLGVDDLFSFEVGGKVGIVTKLGVVIYKPFFDDIQRYTCEYGTYLKCKIKGKTALLSTLGKVVFQPYYEDIFFRADNLLLTKQDGKYGMVNTDGTGYLYPEFDTVRVEIDQDTFFVGSMGEKNIVFNTQGEKVRYFDKDTSIVFIETDSVALFPFAWIAKPQYDIVKYLGSNVFFTKQGSDARLIDKRSQEVSSKQTPISNDKIVNFDWQRVLYKENGLVGMLSYNGKKIVEPKYEDMSIIIPCEVYSFKQNGQWGLISPEGRELTKAQFTGFETQTVAGVQYIKTLNEQNRRAVLTKEGRPIFQPYFTDINPANEKDFFNQEENGGKGIINRRGVAYVLPEYDEVKICICTDTFFVARRDMRYTIYDTKHQKIYDGQNQIIDIISDSVLFFDGKALKKSLITKKGIAPQGRTINTPFSVIKLLDNTALIAKDRNGWAYLDHNTLKPLNNKRFEYLTPFCKGYAFVVQKDKLNIIDNNFSVVMNVIGKEMIKAEKEQSAYLLYKSFKDGMPFTLVRNGDKYGIFRLTALKGKRVNTTK
jgi:hypothetical protein